jgi:hypothetical protein
MPYTVEADNCGSALEGKCLSLAVERGTGTPPGIFYHSIGDFTTASQPSLPLVAACESGEGCVTKTPVLSTAGK